LRKAPCTHLPTIGHLIDGKSAAGGTRAQDVFNPATGHAEKRVLLADKATVEQAIASAQAACPAWRNTPPLKRARVMSKLKVLLEQHADELVRPDHRRARQGAGRRTGRSCSAALKTWSTPATRPSCSRASTARTSARPSTRWSELQALGVAAGITPFNFPPWCRCGCGRWPWPAATPSCSKPSERDPSSDAARGRTGAGGRPAAGRAQRGATATRKRWTRC